MKIFNYFVALLLLPVCLFASTERKVDPEGLINGIFHQVNSLGSLKAATLLVDDLESTIAQWSAGTGTQFGPITTKTRIVFLPHGGPRLVTLKSAYSVRGEPFLELVEAHPRIGPWAPQNGLGGAASHLVFSVNHIYQVSKLMKTAGFKKVASCGDEFAIFEGLNGVLVKVINEDLLPTPGENVSPAPIDLGVVRHVDLAVSLYNELQTQISKLNGSTWTEFAFQDAPFTFEDGTHLINVNFAITDILPELQLEYVNPPLGVFECTETTYNLHPAYVVPPGGMESAHEQMINAGFTLTTGFTLPGLGFILGCYKGLGDCSIEIVDERFNF